jgi:hypothetical protein
VLKKSRVAPTVGDVFAMQLPDDSYVFGLVVRADIALPYAPMPGANLIYIYKDRYSDLRPDPAKLWPGRLLLPPIWTNALGWSRGYFQNVDRIEVDSQRCLPRHCFWRAASKQYVDVTGKPISDRVEPCGSWGLVSYRWIDDHVSDALGIPRVPED